MENIIKWDQGIALCGTYPKVEVEIPKFSLAILDPPYGNIVDEKWDKIPSEKNFVDEMLEWTNDIAGRLEDNAAMYLWGGIGIPKFRPLYSYLSRVEHETDFLIANHITWKKKRAYGIQHNYLFTREELIYLIKGTDIRKPLVFNVPLLKEKRGYAGFNTKYPAKSEYKRRSNVWCDITEIFRGKIHPTQKPHELYEIIIETHTKPGNWVFDPFAGSGTTAVAAINCGRKFIVIEENPEIFKVMADRIDNLVKEL